MDTKIIVITQQQHQQQLAKQQKQSNQPTPQPTQKPSRRAGRGGGGAKKKPEKKQEKEVEKGPKVVMLKGLGVSIVVNKEDEAKKKRPRGKRGGGGAYKKGAPAAAVASAPVVASQKLEPPVEAAVPTVSANLSVPVFVAWRYSEPVRCYCPEDQCVYEVQSIWAAWSDGSVTYHSESHVPVTSVAVPTQYARL